MKGSQSSGTSRIGRPSRIGRLKSIKKISQYPVSVGRNLKQRTVAVKTVGSVASPRSRHLFII